MILIVIMIAGANTARTAMSISIQPVAPEAAPNLGHLFERFPYKAAQRRIQRLDQSRLNAFYLSGLVKSVASGQPHWTASREGEAVAVAGLAPDSWHSQIYGMRMGKLSPWMNVIDSDAGEPLLETALAAARAQGVEHLSVRIDGEDFANLHLFQRAGFLLIDVSMKFSLALPISRAETPSPGPNWAVRVARSEDAPWMQKLGAESHAQTHFLNDPDLSAEKTRELFGAWVARCIEKLAYRIYVLEEGSAPAGFVIYLRNRAFAEAAGRSPIILDYVILDPARRGSGAGPWLVQESLRAEAASGFDYCELRTSEHNHAAIGAYEKLGFRLCATDFVLHKRI